MNALLNNFAVSSSNFLMTLAVPWTAPRLRDAIRADSSLSASTRSARLTAINNTETVINACRDDLAYTDPWCCAALNRVLWSRPSLAFGLTAKAFRDTVSALRQVLIGVGLHADCGYGRNRMTPSWQKLHAALPTPERRNGLLRFVRFLSLAGIEPSGMTCDLIDRFEVWCREAILCDGCGGVARRTAGNWEFARLNVPHWPDVRLLRTDARDHYVIPLTEFPLGFQEGLNRYLKRLAVGPTSVFRRQNPYAERINQEGEVLPRPQRQPKRPLRAQRPRSIESYRWRLLAAATGLVHSGVPIEEFTSLATLVQPLDHAFASLNYHVDRLRAKLIAANHHPNEDELRSDNLATIGEALRQIAAYEVQISDDDLAELTDQLSLLRPETQRAMTDKNAARLRRLLLDPAYSMLLHLPRRWMDRAATPGLKSCEGARWAMFAIALEILLVFPLRRENLLSLVVDSMLKRSRPGALISEIAVPAAITKTRKAVNWPLERETSERIEVYLQRYRPALCGVENRYLFPGTGNASRNAAEFGAELSKRVGAELGAEFNMHLARHFAAVRYLRDYPGAYEVVAQALGHTNPETTRQFYCGLETDAAARHVNANLTAERERTRTAAMAAFHQPPRRRRKGA
jgi:integrase